MLCACSCFPSLFCSVFTLAISIIRFFSGNVAAMGRPSLHSEASASPTGPPEIRTTSASTFSSSTSTRSALVRMVSSRLAFTLSETVTTCPSPVFSPSNLRVSSCSTYAFSASSPFTVCCSVSIGSTSFFSLSITAFVCSLSICSVPQRFATSLSVFSRSTSERAVSVSPVSIHSAFTLSASSCPASILLFSKSTFRCSVI
mmetsp:Transcript_22456/g.45025  ORF Transcript_22456/g.45025 Transcript_22456/m.45025 type:complete len:201 (-) Transcript_22456:187-789(-)